MVLNVLAPHGVQEWTQKQDQSNGSHSTNNGSHRQRRVVVPPAGCHDNLQRKKLQEGFTDGGCQPNGPQGAHLLQGIGMESRPPVEWLPFNWQQELLPKASGLVPIHVTLDRSAKKEMCKKGSRMVVANKKVLNLPTFVLTGENRRIKTSQRSATQPTTAVMVTHHNHSLRHECLFEWVSTPEEKAQEQRRCLATTQIWSKTHPSWNLSSNLQMGFGQFWS
jgi:hypothetical protein